MGLGAVASQPRWLLKVLQALALALLPPPLASFSAPKICKKGFGDYYPGERQMNEQIVTFAACTPNVRRKLGWKAFRVLSNSALRPRNPSRPSRSPWPAGSTDPAINPSRTCPHPIVCNLGVEHPNTETFLHAIETQR